MKRLFWHWVISALALYLAALALHQGIAIKPWYNALWLAPLLGLVNVLVGGVATLLSWIAFPITLITLGCFGFLLSFIGNVLVIYLLGQNLPGIFWVKDFWWAAALAVVMALFSTLLNMILPGKESRRR